MKHIALLMALSLSLSLCNLVERFTGKKTDNSTSSNSSTSSSKTEEPAEKPNPTAAQTAALEGGQTVKWDEQGITVTMPSNFRKVSVDKNMFTWGTPPTFISINISAMDENFPTDVSIKAFYDGQKTRQKNGEVDELKWLELDGVRGIQFRESNPDKPDDLRRLQWMGYRKYAGQVQLVNMILSSNGKTFPKVQDALYGTLYSTKIIH